MEYLCKIIHSTSHSYNRSTRSITKNWYFYKNDILYHLSYHEYQYTILDRVSKQNIISTSKKFYVHVANDKSCYEKIDDIEKWVTENKTLLESANKSYEKSMEITEYINNEIGAFTFGSLIERGWYIPKLLKLTIDLYNSKIVLNHKNKDTILTEKKLKTFIQKNKTNILQVQENQRKEHKLRMEISKEQFQLKKLKEEEENKNTISLKAHDATRKVGSKVICTSFSIHRSLKERYETQACKPLPVKYPWIE